MEGINKVKNIAKGVLLGYIITIISLKLIYKKIDMLYNDIENFVYKTEISTNLIKYQKTYKDKFENFIDFIEIETSEDLYSFHAMPKE